MGKRTKAAEKAAGLVEALKAAIRESGKSQYAIAKESGVALAIVNRFMTGDRDLRLATAAKLCEVLGLELSKRKS